MAILHIPNKNVGGCSGSGLEMLEKLPLTDRVHSEELKNNCLEKYGVFKMKDKKLLQLRKEYLQIMAEEKQNMANSQKRYDNAFRHVQLIDGLK